MWVDILVVMEKDTIRANYYDFEMLYIRCFVFCSCEPNELV